MAAMSIFHLHPRSKGALGGCGIGARDRFHQDQRRNLPGQLSIGKRPTWRRISWFACNARCSWPYMGCVDFKPLSRSMIMETIAAIATGLAMGLVLGLAVILAWSIVGLV